ncbi:hypothetical protein VC83_09409 [Pseudogymnoascus destructans]|uniref:Zn(2)-C6 fungal-type domain-containing protein n=2 Tax=Pseudogymnoascus destructans TaxID=655981 RepID=L8G4B5_PSED2|nr:uncharacterized protein VC83_09409 [Pseudogymnoascus destructans]ELR07629.1 hypothetical protein GMDG_02677 [Pseudogymnoascus destructans 20631-21]OAF54262.1 hypothetical protein VC83_09409 [Pseudogymnoascus destructans]
MADDFNFLNFIEDGSEAPKNTLKETQVSNSDAENAERRDFWDKVPTGDNGAEGSPNSSFNSSPTPPAHHGFPTLGEGHAKQGSGKPVLQRLKDARTYGFRKNVERRVFKGSGAMDYDESGNYDPNEEAAANRRPAKKKSAVQPDVGITQYDSQGEEILLSIEDDVSAEERSVEPKRGKGSKKKTAAAAGRKKWKGKGKAKESETIDEACSACRHFGLECSILDDPNQFPCTTCSEEGIPCVVLKPKTQEAKDAKQHAFAIARKNKADQKRMQREQKKKNGKKIVQLAAQSAAPKIDPKNRKYISCDPCRAGEFNRCSLKTKANVGPCKRCVSRKVNCSFEDKVIKTGKVGTKNGKGGKAAASKASARGMNNLFVGSVPRPRAAPKKKEELPQGMFKKTIKTRFCHPITFDVNVNTTPAPFMGMNSFAQQTPCHFHTTTAFPMLGLGEPVEIEVYGPKEPSPANPFVYKECIPRLAADNEEEVFDESEEEGEEIEEPDESEEEKDAEESEQGEQGPGPKKPEEIIYEDPTFVCTDCTFERQRILFCKSHRIRAVAGLKHSRDFDFNDAISKIWRDQSRGIGSNTAKDILWCSVCVAPAFYECCVPDRFVGEVGCGLRLCEVCAQGLCGGEGKLEGLLDEMAEEQARNPFMPIQKRRSVAQQVSLDLLIDRAGRDMFRYEDGIRADAGFLTNRGELKLWMKSEAVAGPNEYEEPEARMGEAMGAGAAGDVRWGGWGEGMRLNGGRDETFEEYDLRMNLESGKAEQANPAFMSVAPSVSAGTDDWAL